MISRKGIPFNSCIFIHEKNELQVLKCDVAKLKYDRELNLTVGDFLGHRQI